MRQIITTCFVMSVFLAPEIFGAGALAQTEELRDPMKPPAFALQKFRQAKLGNEPVPSASGAPVLKPEPFQLSVILFSRDRKIAVIDDQMLAVGDRIRGAKLVRLTRISARLVREGKVIDLSLDNNLAAITKQAVESDI